MVVCVLSEARCAGPFIIGSAEGWLWWYVCRAKRGVLVLLLVGQPKAGYGGMCAERSEVCFSFYELVSRRLAKVVCAPSEARGTAPFIIGSA